MDETKDFPQHPVYDKNTIAFVSVAAEYCSFLENCRKVSPRTFVENATKIIPLLYLKTSMLPELAESSLSDLNPFVTEEAYEYIRRQIVSQIGQFDEYLEVFQEDMKYSETPILASISEDLTDVYQDLRDMIANFQSADVNIMNDALRDCRDNFRSFWGQRILNAHRALHNVLYSGLDLDESVDEYYEDEETNEIRDFFNE